MAYSTKSYLDIITRWAISVALSRTEAQSVAMCEALACGTLTIATNVGGIPEFVIHGYNGFIVKSNPDDLRRLY